MTENRKIIHLVFDKQCISKSDVSNCIIFGSSETIILLDQNISGITKITLDTLQ